MATELPCPLYTGFFPQMVLTVKELMYYRRFSKERVNQLVHIIEDADCVYHWTDLKARNGRSVQKARFLDIQPATKQATTQEPSTLLKCSVHLVDVQAEEILQAIAKVKTRDARRTMSYLYENEFADTQTLLTFPTSSERKKPRYSYRAIKWSLLKAKRRAGQKNLDFCYLEYAGKRRAQGTSSNVVGFWIQESIAREREVPTLERFDIQRGRFVRSGIVITKTHQSNILKVTAIAQIDGTMTPANVRLTTEEMMVDFVAAVHRVKGLLERQRMSKLQFLDEWEWVSLRDRKTCAVCLRGFYFHRKYHCTTCGEVVCSNCAPLRELEEPLDEDTHSVRVCSVCMAQAGNYRASSMLSGTTESEDGMLETTTLTTNVGTETYVAGLRYPKNREMREDIDDSLRRSTLRPLPPFRQPTRLSSSQSSAQGNDYGDENALNSRATSDLVRRERRSSVLRHSTLSSSTISPMMKKETLEKFMEQARQIRNTIDQAISEAEEEEERHSILLESGSGDPYAGAERYDGIYDRIMKIRETLDLSGLDFSAVLESTGPSGPKCPSVVISDRLDSELAFRFSGETRSEHSNAIESESIEFGSSRSSLLSGSMLSLDHQDAGEPLPLPALEQDNAAEEARAFEEAMKWVRQSEPSANLQPVAATARRSLSTGPVNTNQGIERLARKIGRLHQRLRSTSRSSDATSSDRVSIVADPASSTLPNDPAVVPVRVEDEPEPEKQPKLHQSTPPSALKKSRRPAPHRTKEKHVAIATEAVVLSPSSTGSQAFSAHGTRMPEPSRAPPDLVASLRGVMNSSELTLAPPRRRPEASDAASHAPTSAPVHSRDSPFKAPRRAPPPPPPGVPPALPPLSSARPVAKASPVPTPAQASTMYVFDFEEQFQKVQRRSLDHRPLESTTTRIAKLEEVPRSHAANDDEHDTDSYCLSSSNEEEGQVRNASVFVPSTASNGTRPTRVRDESGELRELMEGLAKAPLRSRCSSGQSTGAPPTEKFGY